MKRPALPYVAPAEVRKLSAAGLLSVFVCLGISSETPGADFIRADGNQDGTVDIGDPIFLLSCLFLGGDCSNCSKALDSNDDGVADIADAIYSLGCLFLGTDCPPQPYPRCGPDPTPDGLLCLSHDACPEAGLTADVDGDGQGEMVQQNPALPFAQSRLERDPDPDVVVVGTAGGEQVTGVEDRDDDPSDDEVVLEDPGLFVTQSKAVDLDEDGDGDLVLVGTRGHEHLFAEVRLSEPSASTLVAEGEVAVVVEFIVGVHALSENALPGEVEIPSVEQVQVLFDGEVVAEAVQDSPAQAGSARLSGSLSGRDEGDLAIQARVLTAGEASEEERVLGVSDAVVVRLLQASPVLQLQVGTFDPSQDLPQLPPEFVATEETGYYIIQFEGPIREEWKESLIAMGVELFGYIPRNALLARMDLPVKEDLLVEPFVRTVGIHHPGFKLAPDLLDATGTLQLNVRIFDSADAISAVQEMEALGATIAWEDFSDQAVLVGVTVDRSVLAGLAGIPAVEWVEASLPTAPTNDLARPMVQSGQAGNLPANLPLDAAGLNASNQIVTVADSGLSLSHEAFVDPNGFPAGLQHRKILANIPVAGCPNGPCGDTSDGLGHGTHVAGTVAGDVLGPGGFGSVDPGKAEGHALGARIIMQDIELCSGPCVFQAPGVRSSNLFLPALTRGSLIHSNSWASLTPTSAYNFSSWDNDRFTYLNPHFLILFSMGNSGDCSGTLSPEAQSKNILSVGALRAPRCQGCMSPCTSCGTADLTDYSARGPASDGRIKPSLVAPGNEVVSADASGNTSYVAKSGTSMATPAVAAGAALVREYFTGGWYPQGQPSSLGLMPSAALLKAVLLGGTQMVNGNGATASVQCNTQVTETFYPNNQQGWGCMNLDDSLYFPNDPRRLAIVDLQSPPSSTGVFQYSFKVTSSAQALSVMLVWTDPPAQAGVSQQLVNNLDLTVVPPRGTCWLQGNDFTVTSGLPASNGTCFTIPPSGLPPDSVNVEERVIVQNPPPGIWTCRIRGVNLPLGPQPFALAVMGALASNEQVTASGSIQDMAIAADGYTVHNAWADTGTGQIQYRVSYDDGQSWLSVPVRNGPEGSSAATPELVGSTSNSQLVWSENTSAGRQVVFTSFSTVFLTRLSPSGIRLTPLLFPGAQVVLPKPSSSTATDPAIAWGTQATHVVYLAAPISGGSQHVYHVRTTDGGKNWTNPLDLTPSSPNVAHPAIAVDGTDVYVVWQDLVTPAFNIFYMKSSDDGQTWSSARPIGVTASQSVQPSIAVSGRDVHVVYSEQGGLFPGVIFHAASPDGGSSWSVKSIVSPLPSPLGNGLMEYPVVQAHGSVLDLVWVDRRTGGPEVFSQRSYDKGASWRPATMVSEGLGSAAPGPKMAVGFGGKVHVLWPDLRTGSSEVFYQFQHYGY